MPQCAVRTDVVVVTTPDFNKNLRLLQTVRRLAPQKLIAKLAIKTLVVLVLRFTPSVFWLVIRLKTDSASLLQLRDKIRISL